VQKIFGTDGFYTDYFLYILFALNATVGRVVQIKCSRLRDLR